MKNLLTYILIGVYGSAIAQNFITIQPAHTKKTIYTLREGETIYQPESELSFSAQGTNYIFTTERNGMYYDVSNKGISKPYETFYRYNWRGNSKLILSTFMDKTGIYFTIFE